MGRLAVAQLCCTPDRERNLAAARAAVTRAKADGAEFVCLPEACDFLGTTREETLALAEPLNGPLMQRYRALAAEHKVWLSLGGLHELAADSGGRMHNTHALIDSRGGVAATYRKMHLFDAYHLRESDTTAPGNQVVVARDTPVGDVGLTTCYDLRFPRLYATLARAGVHVALVPSAFLPRTGAAHWHVLLRARAVENQIFVAAAAQVGAHGAGRVSYGHSLVVGPWGDVLTDAREEPHAVHTVEIERDRIAALRKSMPVATHERDDIFGKLPNLE